MCPQRLHVIHFGNAKDIGIYALCVAGLPAISPIGQARFQEGQCLMRLTWTLRPSVQFGGLTQCARDHVPFKLEGRCTIVGNREGEAKLLGDEIADQVFDLRLPASDHLKLLWRQAWDDLVVCNINTELIPATPPGSVRVQSLPQAFSAGYRL